jgi:hypothetical protein
VAVKIEVGRGNYTALGGLSIFSHAMKRMKTRDKLLPIMPGKTRYKRTKAYEKFHAMTMGFIAGAECLDDMDVLSKDPGFEAVCGKVNASTTYGSFLRSFEVWQPRRMNELLAKTALATRRKLFPHDRDFIIDIDSTSHVQYGKKMEGCAYNYANKWCLDSIQAYDQYGFQYWVNVREGNTHTAKTAPDIIEKVFRQMPKHSRRYMRGDSGYCNFSVFRACADYNVNFVICMRQLMYEPLISTVRNWRWSRDIRMQDGRRCQIGSTVYMPSKLDRETLRVVFIRAHKKNATIYDPDPFEYRAWITNIGEGNWNHEKVVNFYKKRGNAENFIRELKNGFDMHHFPCQKLNANKVYALIAAFAHNLMRIAAWQIDGKIPRFSKMLRFRMVYLAGQVVKKARSIIIRMNKHYRKEVLHWKQLITFQSDTG